MNATDPVGDSRREGEPLAQRCVVCGRAVPSRKTRYCSRACQQRASRLRQAPAIDSVQPDLRQELRRRRLLAAHTVYERSTCQQRYLALRRCEDCNRFCRALGLGGRCSDCDAPILVTDLFDPEVCP